VASPLVPRFRGFDWGRHGVVYAVLFGSAARGGVFRDVDIAVLFEKSPGLDDVLNLVTDLAEALGVAEDRIDIVPLNSLDVPCTLVEEALGKGVIVYCRSMDVCVGDIVRRLEICWDFETSYRKLGLLDAALEAVKRRWVS